jgi:hypothetical protein
MPPPFRNVFIHRPFVLWEQENPEEVPKSQVSNIILKEQACEVKLFVCS